MHLYITVLSLIHITFLSKSSAYMIYLFNLPIHSFILAAGRMRNQNRSSNQQQQQQQGGNRALGGSRGNPTGQTNSNRLGIIRDVIVVEVVVVEVVVEVEEGVVVVVVVKVFLYRVILITID